jgi:hypothetical protein
MLTVVSLLDRKLIEGKNAQFNILSRHNNKTHYFYHSVLSLNLAMLQLPFGLAKFTAHYIGRKSSLLKNSKEIIFL